MKRPDLPLAAAAARLKGKPGRPRKYPQSGHVSGTPGLQPRADAGPERGALAQAASALPRLLDLQRTAAYLGVSSWTVRDLEASGILRRVRVPLPNNGELRKLLFDREDLDRLITMWKEAS